ncbi:MAG: EAL domain-containing protein [Thermomicrobiales bacterium]
MLPSDPFGVNTSTASGLKFVAPSLRIFDNGEIIGWLRTVSWWRRGPRACFEKGAVALTSRAQRSDGRREEPTDVAPRTVEVVAPDRASAPLRWDHFRTLVETLPAIVYVQRVDPAIETVYISPRAETILGWRRDECVASANSWFAFIHPDDRARVDAAVAAAIATATPLRIDYRALTRDGRTLWLRDQAAPLSPSAGAGALWQGMQTDITADKAAEEELHHLAYADALTGLPNRRWCLERLTTLLTGPRQAQIALLYLDLDRFKVINDGIGHAAGDELLLAVARRLTPLVAGHGSLTRFGGDEFVAILDEEPTLDQVVAIAESLVRALRQPVLVRGYELIVEGTVGAAFSGQGLTDPDDLLRAADVALYRAKADGGSAFALFDPAVDRSGLERLALEADLRRALGSREFQIVYQPVVEITSGAIQAVEALLRWHHPERGVLSPDEFIRLADETGLIVPLGKWVIEEACRQVREWQERFPAARGLELSVNLSGRQFQGALAADVALALNRSGLDPASLALELTEIDVQGRSPAVAASLRELKALGVRVTIDDFGSGWSALSSLTRFTIDDLKIDGSCVSRVCEHDNADVVRALVGMAKAIGLPVTAEAVENGEQLEILRALGCDRAQGHHFSPPLRVEEMERLFDRDAPTPTVGPR